MTTKGKSHSMVQLDHVRLKWAALLAGPLPGADQLSYQGLTDSFSEDLLLAVDSRGRPHILVSADAHRSTSLPTGSTGVTITSQQLALEGTAGKWLDIHCPEQASYEVFEHFAVALIQAVEEDSGSPAEAALRVYATWTRFFRTERNRIGLEGLTGVFGELLALRDVVSRSENPTVSVWTGPLGSRHDLRCGKVAMEVKTSRSHTGNTVNVHGLDQLEAPTGGQLYLHFVRVENVPGGESSVADLVESIIDSGQDPEEVYDLLSKAGIGSPSDLAATRSVRFDVRERMTFLVDKDFPRLTALDFIAGMAPSGVVDIAYGLDLAMAGDALGPESEARAFASFGA